MDTINLEPTTQGYVNMAKQFKQSIAQHEQDIAILEEFINSEVDVTTGRLADLIDDAVPLLITQKQDSINELQIALQSILRYLAMKGITV